MKRALTAGKINLCWVLAALVAAGGALALGFALKRETRTGYAEVQLRAARRMRAAEELLLETVRREGIEITEDDVNGTGLIGPEWTPLTTSLGHLEAKRSALNPNFAALLVRYYEEAGLQAGDVVAIGTSGSFPGLAIASLCAANEMGLEVRVIASFGASMYGGTRPELTIMRMYRLMREAGLAEYALLAVSAGGDDDHGESVLYPDEARRVMGALKAESGVEFIDLPTIEESIARRLELYGADVDLFVNVGGASANSGTSSYTLAFPNGLVTEPPRIPTTANRGLMYEYAARGIPVVNMLNVRQMCQDNGLPYDPVPLPEPGEGGVYYHVVYDTRIALLGMALALALLALGRLRFAQTHRERADGGPEGQ